MPLHQSYASHMRSNFADVKNIGIKDGGAITAALFLQRFIRPGIAWAHLDIAGPVWADQAAGLNPAGGTGVMVRTICEYLLSLQAV